MGGRIHWPQSADRTSEAAFVAQVALRSEAQAPHDCTMAVSSPDAAERPHTPDRRHCDKSGDYESCGNGGTSIPTRARGRGRGLSKQ